MDAANNMELPRCNMRLSFHRIVRSEQSFNPERAITGLDQYSRGDDQSNLNPLQTRYINGFASCASTKQETPVNRTSVSTEIRFIELAQTDSLLHRRLRLIEQLQTGSEVTHFQP